MTAAAQSASTRLEASGLQKSYGTRTVVRDVNLAVEGGEVVGLLGPNGAGHRGALIIDSRSYNNASKFCLSEHSG